MSSQQTRSLSARIALASSAYCIPGAGRYALEFIRRFLQHVLPAGFQKVRHYGFLSPNSGTALEEVRWLVTVPAGAIFALEATQAEGPKTTRTPRCAACGGPMFLLGFVPAPVHAVFDTS